MKTTTLSASARNVLARAAKRDDGAVLPPERLPAAAQRAVIQSLLKSGLVEESAADDGQPAWRATDGGQRFALRITTAGLSAIGAEPTTQPDDPAHSAPHTPDTSSAALDGGVAANTAQDAPVTAHRPATTLNLRTAAQAVLAAWDDAAGNRPVLPAAVDALRAALTRTAVAAPRPPRPATKRAAVIVLLRRPEGATVAQVAETTGWARHTVHGFFAGLKKQGVAVEVLDRVRQVGPGKQGAAGSYTVYRVAGAS